MAVIPHSKWNNLTNHQILKPQTHQKDMCLAMPRYVIFFLFHSNNYHGLSEKGNRKTIEVHCLLIIIS